MNKISGNSFLNKPLLLVLLVTGLVYFPGLNSYFYLDDFQNLMDLSVISERGIGYYILGNSSGPSGRPISLLSFALQAGQWPANPFAFKLVNLIIHLLNGALIYIVCKYILALVSSPSRAESFMPSLIAGAWLLHPIQMTTVLYVVQRMTLLASLFMLVGMVAYLYCRSQYTCKQDGNKIYLCIGMVYICTLLAVFCKEIGILLPLYVLVMEYTLLTDSKDRQWRRSILLPLLLPLMVFLGYLISGFDGVLASYQIRDYTMSQRLITEANVLLTYLKMILFPVSGGFSIFHDDYQAAGNLLSPWYTLVNISLVFLLISTAFIVRRRAPVFSFAIFWFFAGHLLESSVINLELFFEHRNYLPCFGILVFVIWIFFRLASYINSPVLRFGLRHVFPVVILAVAIIEANVWSSPQLQAAEWVRHHPGSKRAMENQLNIELMSNNQGRVDSILAVMSNMDSRDIYPSLKKISIVNCYRKENLNEIEWNRIIEQGENSEFRGTSVLSELRALEYRYTTGNCNNLQIGKLYGLVKTFLGKQAYQPVAGELHEIAASYAISMGHNSLARDHIQAAISIAADIDRKVLLLRILVAEGDAAGATALLPELREGLKGKFRQQLYYKEMLDLLEQQVLLMSENNNQQ